MAALSSACAAFMLLVSVLPVVPLASGFYLPGVAPLDLAQVCVLLRDPLVKGVEEVGGFFFWRNVFRGFGFAAFYDIFRLLIRYMYYSTVFFSFYFMARC